MNLVFIKQKKTDSTIIAEPEKKKRNVIEHTNNVPEIKDISQKRQTQ